VNDQLRQEKKKRSTVSQKQDSSVGGDMVPCRFKIKWKTGQSGLTEELIHHLFSKYGELEALVVSKKSSAIVEYKFLEDARRCLAAEDDLKETYEINLKWLGPQLDNKIKEEKIVQINGELDFDEMEREILKKLKQASEFPSSQ